MTRRSQRFLQVSVASYTPLFVSSNPSIDLSSVNPEVFPRLDWSDDVIVDFFSNRFDIRNKWTFKSVYPLLEKGGYAAQRGTDQIARPWLRNVEVRWLTNTLASYHSETWVARCVSAQTQFDIWAPGDLDQELSRLNV